ncbi:MAG: branched-chain amino acid ABC transporter permease [Anaerolineae bacterium]
MWFVTTLAFHRLLRNFLTHWLQDYHRRKLRLADCAQVWLWKPGFRGGYDEILYYYLGLILFGITTYAIWRILHSPIGVAFRALRDSETYAISRGVDPFRFKLLLFMINAFFTGLAGGFLTHYLGAISTGIFNFGVMINLLAMIVLGGWGTFWGSIVGTAVLTALPEVLRSAENYRNLSIGLALALIAVLAPQGLGPLIADGVKKLFRKTEG